MKEKKLKVLHSREDDGLIKSASPLEMFIIERDKEYCEKYLRGLTEKLSSAKRSLYFQGTMAAINGILVGIDIYNEKVGAAIFSGMVAAWCVGCAIFEGLRAKMFKKDIGKLEKKLGTKQPQDDGMKAE